MSRVLVCGSIALDVIGRFKGSFADYQANYPIKALNVSLQLAELRTSFGGCGMNIAYGLSSLGVNTIPLSAVGRDFLDHYSDHLTSLGLPMDYIAVDMSFDKCASAFVITDDDGNQFTAFHAGAAVSPQRVLPSRIAEIGEVSLAVLAPEDAPIMQRQARDLKALGIPMIFDPGQGLAGFNADEARELLDLADIAMVNRHEYDVLQSLTGMDHDAILARMQQVVVTHGAEGVEIFTADEHVTVPACETDSFVDPTGCGDAFRAGYVFGLVENLSLAVSARLGNLMAVRNLACRETQTYQVSREVLLADYERQFGEPALPA